VSFDPERPEDALKELGEGRAPADGAANARARRERTVAHLRGLQARAAVRREIRASWRKRWLLVAALLVPSAALAASPFIPWARFVGTNRAEPDARSTPAERDPARHAPATASVHPARVASVTPEASAPSSEPSPTNVESAPATPPGSSAPASPGVRAASTLADENQMMQAALLAAREGQNGRAVVLLTELIRRFPGSPLVQNAMVERFRALERSGDQRRAGQQARRYLDEYPSGMAADEARQLAGISTDRESRDAPPR
jgi:hypothetical protein